MHPSTAATIMARQAIIDLCHDGDTVVIDVEKKVATWLTDEQAEAIRAALEVLELEIRSGTDQEIREARQILTDQARAAQEAPAEDIE